MSEYSDLIGKKVHITHEGKTYVIDKHFLEQKNKMQLYDEKVLITKNIIESIRTDVKSIYDLLDRAQVESINVIEELDSFIYKQNLLKEGKYIVDGVEFDIQKELKDYFEWYEEECNKIVDSYMGGNEDYYFFSPEKELLDYFDWDFQNYILYAQFVKWSLTDDEDDLENFLEILEEKFIEGFLCPVDREEYWRNEYSQFDNLNVDERLVEWTIYVNRFYDVYKNYISIYLQNRGTEDRVELLEQSEIWDTDCIFSRIRCIEDNAPYDVWFIKKVNENPDKKMELWRELINGCNFEKKYYETYNNVINDSEEILEEIKSIRDLLCDSEKYNKFWKNCELTPKEYINLTRDLSEEKKFYTGKNAYWDLIQNIEAINISKWIIKSLIKINSDYEFLYKSINNIQDKLVKLVYGDRVEYEEQSVSQIAATGAIEHYKKQCLMEITARLIEYIAKEDIEGMMQCKKDIMPLCKTLTPWLNESIEKNILVITKRLEKVVSETVEFKSIQKNITESFSKVLPDDVLHTLSTAEYLYNIYIVNQEKKNNWDYSFVSILYYQVLEKTSNILIYQEYLSDIKGKLDVNNYEKYFGKAICGKKYYDKRKRENVYIVKESLELGPTSFLINEIKNDDVEFAKFIKRRYPEADFLKLLELSEEMESASKRRNNAAHPYIIDYETAKEDKVVVYENESYKESKKLHDLFVRIIQILGI